ncbi:hypothetical protein [Undibacterium sp.]|jgi:hypothetical protein|uniref:hypothetical protein n=1 Tax=Undibacterium sp. TaxID=1914977 RepID=UPI002C7745D8|nr:hypothetical protein [Undibacterium sp.]HTD04062.1 hypothetical protein [Undibacterium sp.]
MDQKLSVEFDDNEVRVIVLEQLEATWNQEFRWNDIDRVCFKDGGLYSSDVILIELKGRQTPAVILTEARGGNDFFGALTDRGYFPEEVWRRAMGETSGAMYCWPQKPAKEPSA